MFGLVATQPVALGPLLVEGGASLRALSEEHGDGWGVATHDAPSGWSIEKHTARAAACPRFAALADRTRARHVIAHIRKATIGGVMQANTHPFVRGRYVLAHNGTIKHVAALGSRSSAARLAEIEGSTDSERFFAFLLSRVDEAADVERGVTDAVRELRAIAELGSVNFLFSDGARLFAYRQGRSLFAFACLDTGVAAIASEPMSGAAWTEIEEGTLVALDAETARLRRIELEQTSRRSTAA